MFFSIIKSKYIKVSSKLLALQQYYQDINDIIFETN